MVSSLLRCVPMRNPSHPPNRRPFLSVLSPFSFALLRPWFPHQPKYLLQPFIFSAVVPHGSTWRSSWTTEIPGTTLLLLPLLRLLKETLSNWNRELRFWFMLMLQTLALKVSIHCEGCKREVKRVLQHIDGCPAPIHDASSLFPVNLSFTTTISDVSMSLRGLQD